MMKTLSANYLPMYTAFRTWSPVHLSAVKLMKINPSHHFPDLHHDVGIPQCYKQFFGKKHFTLGETLSIYDSSARNCIAIYYSRFFNVCSISSPSAHPSDSFLRTRNNLSAYILLNISGLLITYILMHRKQSRNPPKGGWTGNYKYAYLINGEQPRSWSWGSREFASSSLHCARVNKKNENFEACLFNYKGRKNSR